MKFGVVEIMVQLCRMNTEVERQINAAKHWLEVADRLAGELHTTRVAMRATAERMGTNGLAYVLHRDCFSDEKIPDGERNGIIQILALRGRTQGTNRIFVAAQER